MLGNLRNYRIILGSKSPRRRELLQMLRVQFTTVMIEGMKETYPADMEPDEVPRYLSNCKADLYLEKIKDDEMVITADTLVISEGRILGKPHSSEEAIEMLISLSGKTHKVITGVTIATRVKRTSFTSMTKVTFAELSREEAEYYVYSCNPLDKAGAYGIQEWIGAVAVERIDGSFYNVMGLPVNRLYHELKNW